MNINSKNNQNIADYLGAIASFICMIHCIATPFVFVAKACTHTCCQDAPLWWRIVDYIFLIVSFFAIYFATKSNTKKWITINLWLSWFVLSLIIINESINFLSLPEKIIYVPAIFIVVLHIYNQRYGCKCDKACR